MSRRRDRRDEEPTLFDLPLDDPAERDRPAPEPTSDPDPEAGERPTPGRPERPSPEPVPDRTDRADRPPETGSPRAAESAEAAPGEEVPELEEPVSRRSTPPLSVRLLAGLADLAIHLALGVVLLFGARLLGVRAGLGDWPPIAVFLLIFSLLYSVLPLAFWGQTPGMAWAGVEARARDGGSLTFGQTVRRWLGGVLTVALVGLPLLLAAGDGRTLADRLSDSQSRLTE